MLIIPNAKVAFIHIPRTGGNALHRSIASEIAPYSNLHFSTWNVPPLHRHATIFDIKEFYPSSQSFRFFAVDRDYEQIVRSDMKLWASYRDELFQKCNEQDKLFIEIARTGDYERFKRARWDKWIGKGNIPWDHWCDSSVERVMYEELADRWDELCLLAGCKRIPENKRIDWQKHQVSVGY